MENLLPFRYKSGENIQFYKCQHCGDIITGCFHHFQEYCQCRKSSIDQEPEYCRIGGSVINVTLEISHDEMRRAFTKTTFNHDRILREWMKQSIKTPPFTEDYFDLNYYKQLYEEWCEINDYRSCSECRYFDYTCKRNSKAFHKRYSYDETTDLCCIDIKVKCDKFDQ